VIRERCGRETRPCGLVLDKCAIICDQYDPDCDRVRLGWGPVRVISDL
jgi:hypothetical protein